MSVRSTNFNNNYVKHIKTIYTQTIIFIPVFLPKTMVSEKIFSNHILTKHFNILQVILYFNGYI